MNNVVSLPLEFIKIFGRYDKDNEKSIQTIKNSKQLKISQHEEKEFF